MKTKFSMVILVLAALAMVLSTGPAWAKEGKIVHDAEYYILEAQNGENIEAGVKQLRREPKVIGCERIRRVDCEMQSRNCCRCTSL